MSFSFNAVVSAFDSYEKYLGNLLIASRIASLKKLACAAFVKESFASRITLFLSIFPPWIPPNGPVSCQLSFPVFCRSEIL